MPTTGHNRLLERFGWAGALDDTPGGLKIALEPVLASRIAQSWADAIARTRTDGVLAEKLTTGAT